MMEVRTEVEKKPLYKRFCCQSQLFIIWHIDIFWSHVFVMRRLIMFGEVFRQVVNTPVPVYPELSMLYVINH